MERYNSYKDSGVKWLGEIPSRWKLLPGLAVLKENKERNYDEIQKITDEKNAQFMQETNNIDEQLLAFELFLQEKQEENMQILKEIKEHFDENGLSYGNQLKNQRFLDDSNNKIIEEDEEKQQEAA